MKTKRQTVTKRKPRLLPPPVQASPEQYRVAWDARLGYQVEVFMPTSERYVALLRTDTYQMLCVRAVKLYNLDITMLEKPEETF